MQAKAVLCGVLAAGIAALAWAETPPPPADPLAPIGLGDKPPVAKSEPVTETLYGTQITDPYRQFEKMGPDTVDWMNGIFRLHAARTACTSPRLAYMPVSPTGASAIGRS